MTKRAKTCHVRQGDQKEEILASKGNALTPRSSKDNALTPLKDHQTRKILGTKGCLSPSSVATTPDATITKDDANLKLSDSYNKPSATRNTPAGPMTADAFVSMLTQGGETGRTSCIKE